MDTKLQTIIAAADLLSGNDAAGAQAVIDAQYPHRPAPTVKRRMTVYEKLRLYMRDGFIDRYDGSRLVFPNVLRILSLRLGGSFPYHPNWKMSECHIAYWELLPTYDHIVPVARGGADEECNIVTTSMRNNSLKSNFLLEEIGFTMHERGNIEEWDGLIGWYESFTGNSSIDYFDDSMREWHNALVRYRKETSL